MPDENVEYPERGYNTADLRAVAPKPKRRRWWLWALTAFVVAPAALFALWAVTALHVAYSRGERAGIVQKFSRKGWVCKTWEGELAMATIPGAVPEKFAFTVRDDSVANVVNTLYRQGVRTSLSYAEHRGLPTSCFGDTRYFVTGAEAIGGVVPGAMPSATGAVVPGAAVTPAAPVTSPAPPAPASSPSGAGSGTAPARP